MEERHQEISETIQLNGKITIAEITNKYGISDESARRDLRLLEQKGICKRTHGGFETEIQPEAAAKPDADAAALWQAGKRSSPAYQRNPSLRCYW